MRLAVASLTVAMTTAAVFMSAPASAAPVPGTPEFDTYMQALQRNGYNLTVDTALHAAQVACDGGWYATLPYELIPQGVIGKGAVQRVLDVAQQYACPIQ